MKQLPLLLNLILLSSFAMGQTLISGKIKDPKGKGVAGASISLKDSYDGGTSDSTGLYRFKTTETGEHLIMVTCIGYKPIEQKISIGAEALNLDLILKEEPNELKAVVITAGTFEASDRKRAAAVLNSIDIVTTASANGDVTGAIKTLPGAQQVGESEGLFVRGGTAAETKIYIDGTLVNNFFFSSVPNVAQFGRFSPFLFKGTVFSTGGYSALYGQALSSALILESIDLPDQTSANIGVTILGVNAGYQQLAKNKKSSWGGGYSYTNLWPAFKIIKQRQDYKQAPVFHNADFNFRIKTSKTGIIKYYGYLSTNQLDFTVNSLDSLGYKDRFGLKNLNTFHNLTWRENLGRRWKLNTALSFSINKDDIEGNMANEAGNKVLLTGLEFKNFGLTNRSQFFNSRIVFEKKLKGLSAIRFGNEFNYSNEKNTYTLYNNQQFPGRLEQNTVSGFAEADIYITNNVAAKTGLRAEHSSYLNKTNLAPRISLAYKLGNQSQASLAYGVFYQNPERRYLPAPVQLGFLKASHYIAQYQKTSSLITFRAEVFYKKYHNLLKTGFVNNREVATGNNGFGDAKGFEFFWRDKKTIKNLDYWISYSYLDTKRDFLNFPFAIQPNFAAKHTTSLVVKKFITKLKMNLNGSYNFASGRPYYNIQTDLNGPKFTDRGTIPAYHNVSFSINYLPKIGKQGAKSFAVYVLQVSNVFNTKQVYGYQYSYNALRKEAIVPPSRMFVFIGAFISFGVDRTDDAINSNL